MKGVARRGGGPCEVRPGMLKGEGKGIKGRASSPPQLSEWGAGAGLVVLDPSRQSLREARD